MSQLVLTRTIAHPSLTALHARYWRVMQFAARTALGVMWWDVFMRRIRLRGLPWRTAGRIGEFSWSVAAYRPFVPVRD